MSRRSRLRDLVAESSLADRDIQLARIRAERDSKNVAQGVSALRDLVPGVAGIYGDTVKRDEDKKEKLRLEGREDDALIAKATGAERLAKIKADAGVKAAQEKASAAGAKAKAESDAKAAKATEDADNARGATMAKALADNTKALDKDADADNERGATMADAFRGVKDDLDDPDFADRPAPLPMLKESKTQAEIDLLNAKTEREKNRAKAGPAGPSKKDKRADDAAADRKSKDTREDTDALRKEYDALPAVKTFREVKVARDKVKAVAAKPSAAGDITLVFALMKANDPTSTVRESEFAAAAKAGSLGEQMQAQVTKIESGQLLTPAQRQDFLNQVEVFYGAHKTAADEQMTRYDDIAKRRGLNTRDVTGTAPVTSASGMTHEERRARLAELRAKRGAQ